MGQSKIVTETKDSIRCRRRIGEDLLINVSLFNIFLVSANLVPMFLVGYKKDLRYDPKTIEELHKTSQKPVTLE